MIAPPINTLRYEELATASPPGRRLIIVVHPDCYQFLMDDGTITAFTREYAAKQDTLGSAVKSALADWSGQPPTHVLIVADEPWYENDRRLFLARPGPWTVVLDHLQHLWGEDVPVQLAMPAEVMLTLVGQTNARKQILGPDVPRSRRASRSYAVIHVGDTLRAARAIGPGADGRHVIEPVDLGSHNPPWPQIRRFIDTEELYPLLWSDVVRVHRYVTSLPDHPWDLEAAASFPGVVSAYQGIAYPVLPKLTDGEEIIDLALTGDGRARRALAVVYLMIAQAVVDIAMLGAPSGIWLTGRLIDRLDPDALRLYLRELVPTLVPPGNRGEAGFATPVSIDRDYMHRDIAAGAVRLARQHLTAPVPSPA
jgi:hypothetical protein